MLAGPSKGILAASHTADREQGSHTVSEVWKEEEALLQVSLIQIPTFNMFKSCSCHGACHGVFMRSDACLVLQTCSDRLQIQKRWQAS